MSDHIFRDFLPDLLALLEQAAARQAVDMDNKLRVDQYFRDVPVPGVLATAVRQKNLHSLRGHDPHNHGPGGGGDGHPERP